jgi:hypothetical protein
MSRCSECGKCLSAGGDGGSNPLRDLLSHRLLDVQEYEEEEMPDSDIVLSSALMNQCYMKSLGA